MTPAARVESQLLFRRNSCTPAVFSDQCLFVKVKKQATVAQLCDGDVPSLGLHRLFTILCWWGQQLNSGTYERETWHCRTGSYSNNSNSLKWLTGNMVNLFPAIVWSKPNFLHAVYRGGRRRQGELIKLLKKLWVTLRRGSSRFMFRPVAARSGGELPWEWKQEGERTPPTHTPCT